MAEEVVGLLRNVLQLDRSDYDAGLKAAGASTDAFKSKVRVAMNETERNMVNSELAVKRLAATWSGAGLFRAAERYMAAMKEAGGAEKLNAAERAKANVLYQKAIEKYQLLGKEVPAALLAAEQATRKLVAADAASVVQLDKIAAGMSAVGKAAIAGMGEAESATKKSTAANEANLSSVDKMAAGWRKLGEMGRGRAVQAELAANKQLVAGMSAAGKEAAALEAQLVKSSFASTVANKGFSVLTGTVGQMAAGFTIATVGMRAIDGIVNLGKEAFDAAGKLSDMSSATGLSAEYLQRLDFIAAQTGATLDDFTNASFKLQVRLSSGSSGVNKAVEQLGLNLETLKRSKPDDQLRLITDALFQIGNEQERNRLGVELFGKSYQRIASSVAQNMSDIAKGAAVMADAQIAALDKMADEWDAWLSRRKTGFKAWLGEIVAGFDRLARIKSLEAQGVMSEKERKDLLFRIEFNGENIDYLGELEKAAAQLDARDKARAGTLGATSLGVRAETPVEQLRKLDAAVAALTKTNKADIEAMMALGRSHEEIADHIGTTEAVVARYIVTSKEAARATKDVAKAAKDAAKDLEQFNAELVKWAGTDAIQDAFRELELLEAAEAQGFKLENRTAEQIEQSRQAFERGIKTFTRLGLEVPAKIAAAFQRSAVALANNADYIARFSPLDTSGLVGSPVVGGMVGMAPWRQALMEAEFQQGALAADLTGGILDASGLEGLTAAADGTLIRFKDLNYWMEALDRNLDRLDSPGRNFDGLIRGADVLARSLDQTGLSVSRMVDSVMVGFQASRMLAAGSFSNRLAGGAQSAAALISATGSGSRGSRILGGAATGAAVGSVVPGIGTAVGAGVGALVGWARSMGVPQSEKEARAAFADWQRQVIANFDALARQQGRLTAGMTDWEKMVEAVASAYGATGRSVEDVHAVMARLSQASRESGAAVLEVLEEINGVINEQAADTQILNDALAEYGFTLDEIGEKNLNRTQTQEAKRLAEQYRVLIDSGVDLTAVHERMSGSVSKWLQDTMRTGAAIPSVMQPILENFAKQGQLIDANGLLLDEAAVAGLDFTDTWVDGLDRVAVKLDQVLSRFMQLLGMDPNTLAAAQGSLDAAAPKAPETKTYMTPFGPLVVTKKHDGGMVERAHGGAFVGSRALPRGLFGRLAHDEMPMILQAGEGVTSAAMTARMGGRSWVNAVNRGDVSSAVSMMTGGMSLRDPFADMGRLIDMPNRFAGAAPSVAPSAPLIGSLSQGGAPNIQITVESGAVQLIGSGNTKQDGDAILDTVIEGVHSNRRGFRTKLIQKVGKGH